MQPTLSELTERVKRLEALITFCSPVGAVIPFGGSVAPPGWRFCDGSSYPVVGEYHGLFEVVGFTFGGDGKDTFSHP